MCAHTELVFLLSLGYRGAMLRSLDLFSGIGGLTLALEEVACPVAYCDAAPVAQRVLAARIADGSLPAAPICEDVHALNKKWLRSRTRSQPNAIVAGFPCIGFSCAGKRRGFDNAQSGLFFELLRVADEFQVQALFLENVPNIVRQGMDVLHTELVVRRGFELRWCLFSACEVGAPQLRTRWYCVALKPGVSLPHFPRASQVFDWSREPVARMTLEPAANHFARHALLGNSVVPQAARAVFQFLAEAMPIVRSVPVQQGKAFPKCGCISVDGDMHAVRRTRTPLLRCDLLLLPHAYQHPEPPSRQISTGLVTGPERVAMWGTPTRSSRGMANYLTNKCKHLLHTQVRFEQATPDALRAGKVTPEFVEWLMGFATGWTMH